jgi:hypothetical protein
MVTTKLVIEQMNAYDPEAATPTIETVQPTASETTEVVTATADNPPETTDIVAAPEQK